MTTRVTRHIGLKDVGAAMDGPSIERAIELAHATVAGSLPIPSATPAHGTAFDIAGTDSANVGATRPRV